MVDIKLNRPFRPDIRIVGEERTPVVIIDDPILSTESLIRYASDRANFGSDSQFAYPGIRAKLPAEYADTLLSELLGLITDFYKPPPSYEFRLIHQFFSLVTRQPTELGPLQRVPHFDNHSPYYFATVHYLNPGDFAGTGIFRHRPTGYERIPEDRYPSYVQAAESHIKTHGLPAEKYINASDDHFELIAELEYRPNRLVMYPGNILHSGLIQPDRDISEDPVTGRLTANLFLYFAEPAIR
jgi:hypothetical protein